MRDFSGLLARAQCFLVFSKSHHQEVMPLSCRVTYFVVLSGESDFSFHKSSYIHGHYFAALEWCISAPPSTLQLSTVTQRDSVSIEGF